jgi:hypothetical protein
MGNNLPNEHNVPLNQTMPADNDPSVSMDSNRKLFTLKLNRAGFAGLFDPN